MTRQTGPALMGLKVPMRKSRPLVAALSKRCLQMACERTAGPAGLGEGCAPGLPARARRAKQTPADGSSPEKLSTGSGQSQPGTGLLGQLGGSSLRPSSLGAPTGLSLPCGLPRLVSRAEGRSAPSPSRPRRTCSMPRWLGLARPSCP